MIVLVCFLVASCSACNTRIDKYSTISTVIQKNRSGNQANTSCGIFNNIYGSIHFEENLNTDNICRGDCSLFNPTERSTEKHSHPNIKECFGTIHACMRISTHDWPVFCQVCQCLCERSDDPKLKGDGTDILDSFCLDPLSVDRGFVVTGVRFRKRKNKIHLELQQGKLRNGKIIEGSISWKHTNFCENYKKVVDNFKGWNYNRMKIVLEDIILPNDAVVTGAAFTTSVEGQFLDSKGNIDNLWSYIDQHSQCSEKTIDLVHVGPKLMPPTSFNGTITELSESCKHHVLFGDASWTEDYTTQIVPFVDLQEVVTNPPQPINGIGWFYQGQPGYGGYLALKIFVKKKIHDNYMEENLFAQEHLVPYL